MDAVLAVLLFLHVGGAIVAFGPSFTFPIIGAMGGKEPQHLNFALRVSERLTARVVIPLAVLQGVTGVLLVWKTGFTFSTLWLGLGGLLYLVALTIAIGVALPTGRKLVMATAALPAPAPGAQPPPGPSPEVAALVRRQRMAGMILGLLIVVIVFLMVVKPTL